MGGRGLLSAYDLIRALDKKGVLTAEVVTEHMSKSSADSTRFPDDQSFLAAITEMLLYGRLAQYKVRAVLEALDAFAHTSKSEVQPLPLGLTIEHVMPQTWLTHWPLSVEEMLDPIKEQKAIQRRECLINTLGNLTLITGSLNPALSNSAWIIKRPELLKFSKLNLTQYFHGKDADLWSETAIETRTAYLYDQLAQIWPTLPKPAVA
jgi:hypothetical protein